MLPASTIFKDRRDAGMALGEYLARAYLHENLIVIGIPRGGVEVAYYVAKALGAPLSLIVAKKLPYPGRSEYGFGAIAEENIVYVAEQGSGLPDDLVIDIIEEQKTEILRRINLYRQGRPLPDFHNKTVMLVDDGIATGVTLVPCVRLCRKKGASKIIIAAPVSGRTYDRHLNEADVVEVLVRPPSFYAVGQAYENFGDFTDKQLLELLSQSAKEQIGH